MLVLVLVSGSGLVVGPGLVLLDGPGSAFSLGLRCCLCLCVCLIVCGGVLNGVVCVVCACVAWCVWVLLWVL